MVARPKTTPKLPNKIGRAGPVLISARVL